MKKKHMDLSDYQALFTEAQIQTAVFNWSKGAAIKWPELNYMYHTPNGGSRNQIEAANLKRQGVKAGVPDICLPCSKGNYHGLYIELKRQGGKATPKQNDYLTFLASQGYHTAICFSCDEAIATIEKYMEEPT